MISVVIPTMWKFEPFTDMLKHMVELTCIDEIIIINNNSQETPQDKLNEINSPKIQMYDFGRNMFVNGSWNFGVAAAKNDKICIMNDDLIIDLKVFMTGDEHCIPKRLLGFQYERDHTGALRNPEHINTGTMNVVPLNEARDNAYHWGSCFFIHKSDWIDIPQGLEFYYGDNWVGDTIEARGGNIWVITDAFAYTPTSQTCKEFHSDMLLGREGFIYERLIKNYRERNGL